MATRTVRLDEESERILEEVRRGTGLSASAALKRGLRSLRDQLGEAAARPYEIYQQLDLGPGGYAGAPSTESRRGAREAIRRKHGR